MNDKEIVAMADPTNPFEGAGLNLAGKVVTTNNNTVVEEEDDDDDDDDEEICFGK